MPPPRRRCKPRRGRRTAYVASEGVERARATTSLRPGPCSTLMAAGAWTRKPRALSVRPRTSVAAAERKVLGPVSTPAVRRRRALPSRSATGSCAPTQGTLEARRSPSKELGMCGEGQAAIVHYGRRRRCRVGSPQARRSPGTFPLNDPSCRTESRRNPRRRVLSRRCIKG